MQIYVSGSLAYDRIMNFPGKFEDHILPDKIHMLNVSFTVDGVIEKFGGTAGNIAYSLSLLGERPIIIAAVGRDFEQYDAWLCKLGFPLEGIRTIKQEFTAGAYITTDRSDNQITGFNPGAMKYPSNYRFAPVSPEKALAIVAPGNIEDMLSYSRQCKKFGIPYIFDPGQAIPAISDDALIEMITGAEMVISNDYELEMIKRATQFKNDALLSRCRSLVTTLGEKGSVVYSENKTEKIIAVTKNTVLDPTGAGDAYRAGIIKGMVLKKNLIEACRMGAVSAGYAVEKKGTQEHYFDLKGFDERYRSAFS